jgi:hypothetical protein
MSTDLDRMLDEASRDPDAPIDTDQLWTRGRRRRWARRAGAAGGTAALVLAVALVGVDLAATTTTPEIAPLDERTAPAAEHTDQDADLTAEEVVRPDEGDAAVVARAEAREEAKARHDAMRERLAQEQVAREEEEAAAQRAAEEQALAAEQERQAVEEAAAEEAAAAREPAASDEPEPDDLPAPSTPRPAAPTVTDPCAGHEDRTMEAFIHVAGPVAGQEVGQSFELVGCSNVYEATVRYRVRAGNQVLVDSFTTAECGSGCVGAFRETVRLPDGSGPAVLEVFWDSAKTGEGERDLTAVDLWRRG